MNTAIVLHHYDASKGGAERFAVELARRIAADGHEVHVYAVDCNEDPSGVYYHRVRAVGNPGFLYELTFALNSSAALRERSHDVVIGVNRNLFQDIYVLPGATHLWYRQDLKSFNDPLQRYLRLMSRKINPKYRLMFYLEKRMFGERRLKKIVAGSSTVKESIMAHYGVPPEKIEVIHHDIDLEKFHPRNRTRHRQEVRASLGLDDDKLILFVGHNFRLKGLHPFIRVISTLRKRGFSGFKGLVVGKGKSGAYIREAIKRGCDDLIIYPGRQGDMKKIYAACDILLYPTFYDTFSLTILEALASGLPVVTTRYWGERKLITDGQEGYVVDDPWDTEKLADGVAALLDQGKLAECSANARKLAEKFTPHSYYLRLMELCLEIAEEKKRH